MGTKESQVLHRFCRNESLALFDFYQHWFFIFFCIYLLFFFKEKLTEVNNNGIFPVHSHWSMRFLYLMLHCLELGVKNWHTHSRRISQCKKVGKSDSDVLKVCGMLPLSVTYNCAIIIVIIKNKTFAEAKKTLLIFG